jgi:predicted dehydrogenase
MPSPLRLGLIGAGRIGTTYAELLGIRAIADPARGFQSHTELLTSVEAVIVCTPPSSHAEIVRDSLRAGKHVLCEKPIALSVEEARSLLLEAEDLGLILAMASKFRYVPDVVTAKVLLATGAIGDPLLVENTFASYVPMADRWNSKPEISGGGVLIDSGTHSVDIIRFLLGPIDDVLAIEGPRIQNLPVEDNVQLFASCAGVRATADLSWSLNKRRPYLEIYGTKGTISLDWDKSSLTNSYGQTLFGSGYDKGPAIRRQVANFSHAIRGLEPLATAPDDALASVEVVSAAYASMGGG